MWESKNIPQYANNLFFIIFYFQGKIRAKYTGDVNKNRGR